MGRKQFPHLAPNLITVDIPARIHQAFDSFTSDSSLFALPLRLSGTTLDALVPIPLPKTTSQQPSTFQTALNTLDPILTPKTALYLLLRRHEKLVAITFIPYLANAEQRTWLLEHRKELVRKLGAEWFSSEFVCKEVGEINDGRSWEERDGKETSLEDAKEKENDVSDYKDGEDCKKGETGEKEVKDLGYMRNKCRLCDRRMKNGIDDAALEVLGKLEESGSCVQITVDISTEILQLSFHKPSLPPTQIASHLPTTTPSFTFYRHPTTSVLYFIFCSPDTATVQQRMKHTMAIPGLVNIIAKDNGVRIDQKIEIHEPEELDFAEGDERIGKFRSMYLRNNFLGTESTWEGMGEYQKTLDAVR